MQRKKNIRLLFVLLGLLVITSVVLFYEPSSSHDGTKDLFSIENITEINHVIIKNKTGEVKLKLAGREWEVNDKFAANVARINDLFVIFQKVNVRRKVAKAEQQNLLSKFESEGVSVEIFANNSSVKAYKILQNDKETLTYFIDEDIVYVCNIPGSSYHIARLFLLDEEGWRSKYVFAANWNTLEKLAVTYLDNSGFTISYDPKGYFVEGVDALDTTKMYHYLEQISYLQVESFLLSKPEKSLSSLFTIDVVDAGSQSLSITFYRTEDRYFGSINESQWALFRKRDVELLMTKKENFEQK